MLKRRNPVRMIGGAVLALALSVFAFAASAFAHEGEYARFDFCPSTNVEVFKCIYSTTEGGEVVLGKKTVPIVNPAVLQGGFSKPPKGQKFSKFFEPTNGVTLSKAPQPVPGGLAGIVPPESSPPLVKAALKFFFENGLTGVNSTLELARPANEIVLSELNLASEEGVALTLPVKVHLENPFLGNNCYVGSSVAPLIWNLTTAETEPPPPNTPIHGSAGEIEFLDEGRILGLKEGELVDNAWAAPVATGCGGILSFLVDPIINSQVGLPAAAGTNTAILETTSYVATSKAVNEH
jgi:hypothetical protein